MNKHLTGLTLAAFSVVPALIAGESVSGVVSRSSELDISPYGNIPWRDQMIYNLISFVFSLRD